MYSILAVILLMLYVEVSGQDGHKLMAKHGELSASSSSEAESSSSDSSDSSDSDDETGTSMPGLYHLSLSDILDIDMQRQCNVALAVK